MSNPLATSEPWSLVAAGYKRTTQEYLAPYSLKAIEILAPKKTDRALDVATGPGTLSLPLSHQVAEIDAIDFSAEMIAEQAASIAARSISNIRTHVMDGQALTFLDNHFDLAFSMFGLMFFPDKLLGMKEIFRVLKPGKQVVISAWGPIANSSMMQLMFGAIRAALPETPPPSAANGSLENKDYFKEQLALAGFTDIEILTLSPEFTIQDPGEFFDSMVDGSAPIQLMKRKMGNELFEEKRLIMRAYIEGQLQNLPVKVSSEANLGIARKPG